MRPIETSRLLIRPFTESDLDAVARLRDECFGGAPRAAHRAWLEWSVRNYDALARLRQPPYGDYAVVLKGAHDAGALVGSVGLVPSFGPFDKLPLFRSRFRADPSADPSGLFTPEVGLFWAVAAAYRGAGYATEAARAMAAFAFDQLAADRVVATTEHSNLPSIGVMRRLGMAIERNPDPQPEWFQTVGILYNNLVQRQAARPPSAG